MFVVFVTHKVLQTVSMELALFLSLSTHLFIGGCIRRLAGTHRVYASAHDPAGAI